MSFEIVDRDLMGRIGKIKTKSGTLNTPAFFPVIDPVKNIIDITSIKEHFKINQLMTNSYLIKQAIEKGILRMNDIHLILNFDGVIMTDSGAYQILSYGNISFNPEEAISFQEKLNSDISVILDIPTLRTHTKIEAERTVLATLNNAMMLEKKKTKDDILWVGPIQGGRYLDLIRECAMKMGQISSIKMYGVGGPTQYMKNYAFEDLVDIIMAIKMSLPKDGPLHLFGAGHPILLPFLVALGCDTFDSASYALFAKDDRYITSYGTIKLSNLKYFPCFCDVCKKYEVNDLLEMSKFEREKLLAKHNLWVICNEMNQIKQAIYEGRLWELIEAKSKFHPRLFNALLKLKKYKFLIEKYDPVIKSVTRGIFYTSPEGLIRPEVTRHLIRLEKNVKFQDKTTLILIPDKGERSRKYSSSLLKRFLTLSNDNNPLISGIHMCIYGPPFGIIPLELINVYPLSQYEKALKTSVESEETVISALKIVLNKSNYDKAVVLFDTTTITRMSMKKIVKLLKNKNIKLKVFVNHFPSSDTIIKTISQL
ncbi:MAG: tRNA guanosine(15) transglycosylase TgtA [Candidatus Verstraetearchaeota archaeon]|nr:tRNA guanosine(15) transglycosylase TgtA [Candidatus Verstraetearchaeota archaeon]